MPSMKCYQCGKVKQCTMVQVRTDPDEHPLANTWLSGAIEYLCRPCKRELGYAVNPNSSTPQETRS